jgi:RDD family.
MPYPTLFRRYLGAIVDGLVVLGAMVGGGLLIADLGPQYTWLRGLWLGFTVLGYEPLFTSLNATLGQRLAKYRIRQYGDRTRHISIPAAYFRYAIKLALGIVSFFAMNFNPEQRALHDMAVGSIAITWPPVGEPGTPVDVAA